MEVEIVETDDMCPRCAELQSNLYETSSRLARINALAASCSGHEWEETIAAIRRIAEVPKP